jgi:hypothetical protein
VKFCGIFIVIPSFLINFFNLIEKFLEVKQ